MYYNYNTIVSVVKAKEKDEQPFGHLSCLAGAVLARFRQRRRARDRQESASGGRTITLVTQGQI